MNVLFLGLFTVMFTSLVHAELIDDVRALRVGDRIQIKKELSLIEYRNAYTKKKSQGFLVNAYRSSDKLLICDGYAVKNEMFHDRNFRDGLTDLPKGLELTITQLENVEPIAENYSGFKSIARHKVVISSSSETTKTDTGSIRYSFILTCERDALASKKYRELPIKISEVQNALHDSIQLIAE